MLLEWGRRIFALIMLQYVLHYQIAINFRLIYSCESNKNGEWKSGAPSRRNIYLIMFSQNNGIDLMFHTSHAIFWMSSGIYDHISMFASASAWHYGWHSTVDTKKNWNNDRIKRFERSFTMNTLSLEHETIIMLKMNTYKLFI